MIKHRQLNKHSNTTIKDAEDLLNGTTEVDETNVGILMENYVKELEKVTETLPENEENRKLRKHRAGKKAGISIKSAKGYNKMTSTSNRSERKTGTSNGSGRKRKTASNGKEEKEKQQKYDLEKLRLEITMKEKEASV